MHALHLLRSGWLIITIVVSLAFTQRLGAAELVQHFPADKAAAKMQTSWRIVWDITHHAGRGEILYIKEAWFKRGPKEKEIKVLGDCRIVQIFVPYNDGSRIWDLDGGFGLEKVSTKDLGPACISTPKIYDRKGKVVKSGWVAYEVHDDHLRWKSNSNTSRRGQTMQLWSVLDAANYRYIMKYTFRDDGRIGFALGSTAHNLRGTLKNRAAHLHIGCWRLNVELGAAGKNDILVSRYVTKPGSASAQTVTSTFNGGKEGGIEWKPAEFTRLRIQSRILKNKHQPANYISYELVSSRRGNPRLFGKNEEFTHKDIWVTNARSKKEELIYRRVTKYADGEKLSGPQVIWHQCAVWHSPRDEDFGKRGYNTREGVALTAWCGFTLRPRHFFAKTPLFP